MADMGEKERRNKMKTIVVMDMVLNDWSKKYVCLFKL